MIFKSKLRTLVAFVMEKIWLRIYITSSSLRNRRGAQRGAFEKRFTLLLIFLSPFQGVAMEGTAGFTSENFQQSALDVEIFSEALLSLSYFYLGLNPPFLMAGLGSSENVIVGNNLG